MPQRFQKEETGGRLQKKIFCPSLTLPSFFAPVSPGSWGPEGGCRDTTSCCNVASSSSRMVSRLWLWVLAQQKGKAGWQGLHRRQQRGLVTPCPRLRVHSDPGNGKNKSGRNRLAEKKNQSHMINQFKKIVFYAHQRQSL